MAKLASHSVVANSACSIGLDPDPSVVIPAVVGGESLEDFRLHKNKFQILNYNDTYEHQAKIRNYYKCNIHSTLMNMIDKT